MGQFSLRISPATISNMNIIFALFGFFLTASCLPAPGGINFKQTCRGAHCNQNTGVSAGNENFNANVDQDCEGGNCDQDIAIGVDHSKGWQRSSSTSSGGVIQYCKDGANCQQDQYFGRKKRGINFSQKCRGSHCNQNKSFGLRSGITVDQNRGGEQEMKSFVCAGGVVSSNWDRSSCQIICSDNIKYQHDCGSLTSQVASSPGTGGSTVVTVSCGGQPITSPSSPSTELPQNSVPSVPSDQQSPPVTTQPQDLSSATTLKSCIDACPVATTYRGCVTSCLSNRK